MAGLDPLAGRRILARNLRRWRRERGWTQERLSMETGLAQSYLSEIEAAKRNVSVDNITELARVLDIAISTLFEEGHR